MTRTAIANQYDSIISNDRLSLNNSRCDSNLDKGRHLFRNGSAAMIDESNPRKNDYFYQTQQLLREPSGVHAGLMLIEGHPMRHSSNSKSDGKSHKTLGAAQDVKYMQIMK